MADPATSLSALETMLAGASGPATLFLRAGVFRFDRPLRIANRSEPLTVQPCPGEAVMIEGPADQPAVVVSESRQVRIAGLTFAGPSSVHIQLDRAEDCRLENNTSHGAGVAILLEHSSRNRIVHNVVGTVALAGIELKDGSDGNLVADNVVGGVSARETFGGGIWLHGVRDNRIAHNRVEATAGFGIGVMNWDDATINVGNVVEFNLLRRTVLDSTDSGAIYILGRSAVDTETVVAGNVIDGFGSPGNHNVGIYLDDSTSGASVIGNLVRGAGSDAVQIHGGQDNAIQGNLLDLGPARPSAVLFQAAPADTNPPNRQTGNRVTGNVILSSYPAPRPFVSYEGGVPAVFGNFYVLSRDATVVADPAVTELDALFAAPDLLLSAEADGYRPVQEAAERAIGFRPIEAGAAGVRPVR